jgi:hypothetical protein
MRRRKQWIAFLAGALLCAGAAQAKDVPRADEPEPTPEMRRNMAAVHEQMAACLASERPMAECRDEMHRSCQERVGQGHCPMGGMGPGMMGPGMMGGKRSRAPDSDQ